MSEQRPRSHIMRYGLIFGLILGLLGLGNTLIQWAAGAYHLVVTTTNGFSLVSIDNSGAPSMLGCLVFLTMLLLTLVAGALATYGSGKVRSGALAGLMTGVFGGLISGTGSIVVMALLVAPGLEMPAEIRPAQVETLVIGMVSVVSLLVLLVEIGFGAGMGTLGGLIGANMYRNAAPQAVEVAPIGSDRTGT